MPIRSDEECVYRSWRGIVCPDGSWEGVPDGSWEIISVGPGGALFRASLGEDFSAPARGGFRKHGRALIYAFSLAGQWR
ncbi:MAG TPA: hypothetical protein PKH23_05245, partial [Bacillota bacterium]|nr:hypothetical protein [Bacillota bacterium]